MSALSQQVSGNRGRCPRIPKYCRHKTWNLAYVRIGGRVKYLGPHNSPESLEAYSRIVAEFAAAPAAVERVIAAADDPAMTVAELCEKYLTFAEGYYRKDGRSDSPDRQRPPGDPDAAGALLVNSGRGVWAAGVESDPTAHAQEPWHPPQEQTADPLHPRHDQFDLRLHPPHFPLGRV